MIGETQNQSEYPYEWRGSTRHKERQGQPCRIVEQTMPGTFSQRTVVEFEDGLRVKATRLNIRRRM